MIELEAAARALLEQRDAISRFVRQGREPFGTMIDAVGGVCMIQGEELTDWRPSDTAPWLLAWDPATDRPETIEAKIRWWYEGQCRRLGKDPQPLLDYPMETEGTYYADEYVRCYLPAEGAPRAEGRSTTEEAWRNLLDPEWAWTVEHRRLLAALIFRMAGAVQALSSTIGGHDG